MKWCLVIDNPFNRSWYEEFIGRVFSSDKPVPYANFKFIDEFPCDCGKETYCPEFGADFVRVTTHPSIR
jgi:hypothetical protein